MSTAKRSIPRNASHHVSSTCVARDGGEPCGLPSVPTYNCCYNHLAAGDRRRLERERELTIQPDKEVRVQARGRIAR